ncbi:hypothetical protein GCM10010517_45940 [Streptosporangium fragile]|uniref:Uncharacterized protein n=1 Tax=Streptosporangium fragile TaxID=46186 RepID=A0ABN3W1K7_9ACTN
MQICVRRKPLVRVEDQRCDDLERGHAWYYIPRVKHAPATGKRARGGSFDMPGGRRVRVRPGGGRGTGTGVTVPDSGDRFEVCVRRSDRVRVPDGRCEAHRRGFRWYYIRLSRKAPAVGRTAERGSFFAPGQPTYRALGKGGTGETATVEYAEEQAAMEEEEYEESTDDHSTMSDPGPTGPSDAGGGSGCGSNCSSSRRGKSGRR